MTRLDQAHRPWPVPNSPWMIYQVWTHLLFAHWPVSPEMIGPMIPPGIILDTYEGEAWVGIIPFQMEITLRGAHHLPWKLQFNELNVRTYVTDGEKAGIYFFSLDASNASAVWGAKTAFKLPYFRARIQCKELEELPFKRFDYQCIRTEQRGTLARFKGQYQAIEPVQYAAPDSLAHWLTERYCLYTADSKGRWYRAEIHHQQWPLQLAHLDLQENTMATDAGIGLPDIPPICHYAERLDVLTWPLTPVR